MMNKKRGKMKQKTKQSFYKDNTINIFSSLRTVMILPGDLCGRQMFYFLGGNYE